MRFHPSRIIAALSLMLSVAGCSAAFETQGYNYSLDVATPTPSYSCVNTYSAYDSLAECQTASNATCTSTWETFPSGGVALCYFPPTNYSQCIVTVSNPATWDWVYTPYSAWCDSTPNSLSAHVYQMSRSVIGCSSQMCTCNNPVVTTVTCSGSACSGYSPDPSVVSPAPSPCSI